MSSYLSIDNIQTIGNLPYVFGNLADGTFPGTVITDNILDIDFSAMEMQYDISLNEVHYTVSPVEYVVDGNRYYVLGNARLAFSSDTATDTGEQFAIVVDADAYDSHASTISRKLYIGLLDADDSVEPIDAIALDLKEPEEEAERVDVTRRVSQNTYIFEVDGATSIDTTITKSYGSEMIVHIDSVQTGSGTPSSSNIRPIDGWTGTVISGTNINEQSSYAIDWADSVGTVYGGTLNVNTGLLTITHACINSYNGETLTGRWISSMDAYSSGTTPTIGSQVVYELSSPIKQYIFISNEGRYLELQNPTSNTGSVDIIDYPDEVYTIGTSDADNPLIRRRAVRITGTTGAVIIGNGTLLSLSDYPSYTPVDTGEDFAVLIPDVYATEDSNGEIPATVVISDSFASAMTSEFAIQIIHSGLDRFHTFNVDDYSDYESGETGSLYRMLNEYGQAGPIPDIDDSKYDEALHGQNIIANTILAQQIDVRDLMAQDMEITGNIHSNQKSYADDNHEGVFLGFDSDRRSASFGVGSNEHNHVWYKDGMVDIQADTLKLSSGVDVEEGIRIAQDAGLINSDEITRLLAQTAQIQQMIDQIQLWVSQISTRYSILNGQDISAYEVSDVPTLDNYPAADEFWIWPICNTNIYCSDTLICGTNDYATHKWKIAHCTKDGAYYIFDIDSTQHYYWRQMTDAEYKANSSFYSAVNINIDRVEVVSTQNQEETILSVTKDGVTVTDGKLFCC